MQRVRNRLDESSFKDALDDLERFPESTEFATSTTQPSHPTGPSANSLDTVLTTTLRKQGGVFGPFFVRLAELIRVATSYDDFFDNNFIDDALVEGDPVTANGNP